MTRRTDPTYRCDGVRRRDFVRAGMLSALGLSLADRFSAARAADGTSASVRRTPRARSCILIWLDGGPSHLETFDLKPDAPSEVRGPFQPIATSVPGVHLSEHMQLMAARMDKASLVRSMTSPLGEHNLGAHYVLTGYRPSQALVYPSYGAVVAELAARTGALPPYVAVPTYNRMAGEGYLGATARPFAVGGDPAKPDFQVRDLDLYKSVTIERIERRREFLSQLDAFAQGVESSQAASDPRFEQAYRLVTSSEAKRAFDLSEEPQAVRARYGPRTIGQSCLLARRLVESGVPFVTVNNIGWDTHAELVLRLKEGYTGAKVGVGLIPLLDQALAALIDDLDERGLLDETLVMVMGEFGRTPKINTGGGRDHWPRVFSVLLAGGGVARGRVIGSSDRVGESPADRPITPADLAFTVYTLLGIDPAHMMHTADGRPVPVNQGGQIVPELLA